MRAVVIVVGLLTWFLVAIDRNTAKRIPLPIAIIGSSGFLIAILVIEYSR